MENRNKKVLATMSGGVDSSVAAALLKEQGYHVSGIIMKIWEGEAPSPEGLRHGCYGPGEKEDIEDAKKVANVLGIPLRVADLTAEYKSVVLDYFCQEYLSGRTPNPCVKCNQRIKFGALIQKAGELGLEFDYISSGHYARVEHDSKTGRHMLMKGKDISKDQSYFLSFLSQQQLARLLLPLGNYKKEEVREIASCFGLPVDVKPDSQNFISGDYSALIARQDNPGPILDKQGNILGQHRGIQYYTVGQRKGLGVFNKEILYVSVIDPKRNAVIVGPKADVFKDECTVRNLNWISVEGLDHPVTLKVKIRSSHQEAEALVTPITFDSVRINFKAPQMAISPGQTAVFYDGEKVVGAGLIS